jgi:hypothetical protein
LILVGLLSFNAFGRDVVAEMPSLPSGYSTVNAAKAQDKDRGGLDVTLRLSNLYDSNITHASGNGTDNVVSEWLITPSLQASYLLRNSLWQLGARVGLERDLYQELDEFNATNYSGKAFGGYKSKKVVASFTSGISSTSGFNRSTNGFTEQFSYHSGLLASYRFTGKTSLLASWKQRTTESQTSGFGDTSSLTTGLSALWNATPLISLGPGFRYGTRTGVDNEEFTVIGPTLRVDYQLSTKIKLRSSIGVDFTDSPFTGEDTLWNWAASLNYRASALWGFDLKMIRDTRATYSQGGGFDEISSYRFSYWRKVRRARAELGVSYEDRSPTDSQPTVAGIRDSNYLTFSAALTFPLYKDQADLTLNMIWKDQSTSDRSQSWDGLQTGLGVQWRF